MQPIILLMANVLRLDDHPALSKAVETGAPVIPLYVFDEDSPNVRPYGAASKWWLMHSLEKLQGRFKDLGSRLIIAKGKTVDIVTKLVQDLDASAVYLTRGYTPGSKWIEDTLNIELDELGVPCRRFGGNLLLEPEQVRTKAGGIYTVFTPFWKACKELIDETKPKPAPDEIRAPDEWPNSLSIDDLDLKPKPVNWAKGMDQAWEQGTEAALERLDDFLNEASADYSKNRDKPGVDGTSKMSPYLTFGEISPRMIWSRTKAYIADNPSAQKGAEKFLSEVGWREFSWHLLFNFPEMQTEPMRENFADFPWKEGMGEDVKAWQKGMTGFPIVDAGMRQLWQTGWMHNRVRMIVASFLVKDLLWHWHVGEDWFWDTLVDADFGNNIASWQWVSGCGADAAPYFRIFNPITQGFKFDSDGDYIREFVPELAGLPNKYIHEPFEAPEDVLADAGVKLGETYPNPMVNRKETRARALEAFESIKKSD